MHILNKDVNIHRYEEEAKKVKFLVKKDQICIFRLAYKDDICHVQRPHLTCKKTTLAYYIQRRALGSLQKA